MKGVILCGGLATRFLPISKSVPKEMLPILGRPAIDYIVSDFRQNGITDILVILGRNKECLENFYDRNIELESRLMESGKYSTLKELENLYTGVNITFARQIHAKGTGYAVSLCKEFVGNEPFIVSSLERILLNNKLSVIPFIFAFCALIIQDTVSLLYNCLSSSFDNDLSGCNLFPSSSTVMSLKRS